MDVRDPAKRHVVGGVDTHKDLHVAAVVDERDRVLGSRSFATTRQGYRQMLAWMGSFGEVQRIGIESTRSYGAGLLRFVQTGGIEVLEVTTPDRHDRRRRGKNDDLDAQNAAHAAFAGQRTVTPRSRDGMVESLRVLSACRKTAVAARRVALQLIQNTIVCAPDGLRDDLRSMTRMQLIRTLAAWRPDLTAYRDVEAAYRITFKSLARRYLELHDEIADLDIMIGAIVDELAPTSSHATPSATLERRSCCSRPATILIVSDPRPALPRSAGPVRFPPHPAKPSGTASTEAAIGTPTAPCTSSRLAAYAPIRKPRSTWPNALLKGIRSSKPFGP